MAFLVLFVIREHHAADPILPMDLMVRPVIAASLVGSCLIGAILFGIDTYVPLYIQGVQGGDARLAGRALMPLFLTWAFSVAVAAKAVVHRGLRFGCLDRLLLHRDGLARVWSSARPSRIGTASASIRGWCWWGWGWARRRSASSCRCSTR